MGLSHQRRDDGAPRDAEGVPPDIELLIRELHVGDTPPRGWRLEVEETRVTLVAAAGEVGVLPLPRSVIEDWSDASEAARSMAELRDHLDPDNAPDPATRVRRQAAMDAYPGAISGLFESRDLDPVDVWVVGCRLVAAWWELISEASLTADPHRELLRFLGLRLRFHFLSTPFRRKERDHGQPSQRAAWGTKVRARHVFGSAAELVRRAERAREEWARTLSGERERIALLGWSADDMDEELHSVIYREPTNRDPLGFSSAWIDEMIGGSTSEAKRSRNNFGRWALHEILLPRFMLVEARHTLRVTLRRRRRRPVDVESNRHALRHREQGQDFDEFDLDIMWSWVPIEVPLMLLLAPTVVFLSAVLWEIPPLLGIDDTAALILGLVVATVGWGLMQRRVRHKWLAKAARGADIDLDKRFRRGSGVVALIVVAALAVAIVTGHRVAAVFTVGVASLGPALAYYLTVVTAFGARRNHKNVGTGGQARRSAWAFATGSALLVATSWPFVFDTVHGGSVLLAMGVLALSAYAGLAIAVQTWGMDVGHFLCLRIPAACAIGTAVLFPLGAAWWDASAWVFAVGVLAGISFAYLTAEVLSSGVSGPQGLLRSVTVWGLGAIHAVAVVSVALQWLAPVFLDGFVAPADVGGLGRIVVVTATASLALGLLLQILWDDRTITHPLLRTSP